MRVLLLSLWLPISNPSRGCGTSRMSIVWRQSLVVLPESAVHQEVYDNRKVKLRGGLAI
jgi:hypothetical protein